MTGSTMSDGTPVVADGRVYVGNQTADRMLAYDAGTGRQLWQSANTLGGWQDGIPTAADGRVFIGANNALVARDAETGQDLWTHRSPGTSNIPGNATPASVAVVDGTVYMGSNNGSAYALDRATGQVVWEREIGAGVSAGPAVSGNTVVFGAWDGKLYAFTEQN